MKSTISRLREDVTAEVHSIRFRMAAWFMLVLGLVLLFFGGLIYAYQADEIRREAENRLDERIQFIQDGARHKGLNLDSENLASLSLSQLEDNQALIVQGQEGILLVDLSGNVISHWGDFSLAAVPTSWLKVSDRGERIQRYTTVDGAQIGAANNGPYLVQGINLGIPENPFGYLVVLQPVDPYHALARLFWVLLIRTMIVLVLACGGSYWLVSRALRPVNTIIKTAQEISETDLSRRLNLPGQDELAKLGRTFDHMLDRLQAAFIRQRQFTADASHELRTPLSIVALETERALGGDRSPREYRQALEIIQSENQFITRMVNELLTLARMDAGQAQFKIEELDLSDVALDVIERYSNLAASRGIRLLGGDLPEVTLRGDRVYLTQMVGNLVDNALKYQVRGEDAWVRVETGVRLVESGQRKAFVRVSDNGPGIDVEHQPRLFDRFYRVDESRSHNPDTDSQEPEIPGSGLGLSIVQWIAQEHGGRVTVTSHPGEGSAFEVELSGELNPSRLERE